MVQLPFSDPQRVLRSEFLDGRIGSSPLPPLQPENEIRQVILVQQSRTNSRQYGIINLFSGILRPLLAPVSGSEGH